MNFEDWQKVWQDEPPAPPEDVATILAGVRRKARAFDRTIFWRDAREVLAALFVAVAFGWTGFAANREGASPWLCWIAALIPLGVAGYLWIDRRRMRRARAKGGETVLAEIDRALAEVRHQAWLLKNVIWWYLLPLAASTLLFLVFVLIETPLPAVARVVIGVIMLVVIVAVDIGVWWLNRLALRRHLEPRVSELEEQRESLTATPADASDSD